MTENLNVKASKAVEDVRVAAHAAYDDTAVAIDKTLKKAGGKAKTVSGDLEIGVHKAVADVKIAAHKAESKLKRVQAGHDN
jgi:flagellar hook-basal body complex protein FliE